LATGNGEITDTSGATVNAMQADPFGQRFYTGSTSAPRTSLALPGQIIDIADRHYNLYRDYDPTLGHYLQADPIGLEGGDNVYGYVGGNPIGWADPEGLCPCGKPGLLIAAARGDSRDWRYEADRSDVNGGFGRNTNKCNLFVDTQFEAAGYRLPNIGGNRFLRALGRYPPGAANLSRANYALPGWPVVSGPPQPGDLIAYGGHVGIVTGEKMSISASPNGRVENDWGFRRNQKPVIRRCRCGG
jgi:RHS repeat-associated protein